MKIFRHMKKSKKADKNTDGKKGTKRKSAGMKSVKHSPTLRTIRMVEKALIDMPGSVMKISELKRALPRKVNHNTLMEVIDYLEECNRIYVGRKGITWLVNNSPKMRRALQDAREKGRVF